MRSLRDGIECEISTRELVPGDIVRLEQGLNVPADIRIIESLRCKIDESALTGEPDAIMKTSELMEKDTILAERNMAYMGTVMSSGRGTGIVVRTGMLTELGKIASDIASAETPKTPLELKLESLGKFLTYIAFVVAVLLISLKVIVSLGVENINLERSSSRTGHHSHSDCCGDCTRRFADYIGNNIGHRYAKHGPSQGDCS